MKDKVIWILSPEFIREDERADGRNLDQEILEIIETRSTRTFVKNPEMLPSEIYFTLTNTGRQIILRGVGPYLDGRICRFESVDRVYEHCPVDSSGARQIVRCPTISCTVLTDDQWRPHLNEMLSLCHERELKREEHERVRKLLKEEEKRLSETLAKIQKVVQRIDDLRMCGKIPFDLNVRDQLIKEFKNREYFDSNDVVNYVRCISG